MQIEPMPPERWERIEHLYHATLEREPDRRAPFLAETCAGDEALRWEVESLVAAHDRAGDLIEAPPIEVAAQLMAERRVRSLVGGELGSLPAGGFARRGRDGRNLPRPGYATGPRGGSESLASAPGRGR